MSEFDNKRFEKWCDYHLVIHSGQSINKVELFNNRERTQFINLCNLKGKMVAMQLYDQGAKILGLEPGELKE